MTLGIMQPYFLPYIGYFQLMKMVDRYVIYDDVNYIKGGWINRNNLLTNGQKQLFTLSLDAASPNKKINEIRLKDDFSKFRKTIDLNYSKAPCYGQFRPVLEEILTFEDRNLARFIAHSIHRIADYLEFDTRFCLSSDIEKDPDLHGQDRVIDICNRLSADRYVNAIGGRELYDVGAFARHGVELKFLSPKLEPYPQLRTPDFVPGLSLLDVLMNVAPAEANRLLEQYELI